jgi:hypothetical protein
MKYLNNLEWSTKLDQFGQTEQQLLLALSHAKYKWRTRDRLLEATGLPPERLDSTLSKLISRNIVRPSFSKTKQVIFGLRERVG